MSALAVAVLSEAHMYLVCKDMGRRTIISRDITRRHIIYLKAVLALGMWIACPAEISIVFTKGTIHENCRVSE